MSNSAGIDIHDNSFGFIRVASAVPTVFVASPHRNAEQMIDIGLEAAGQGVQVILFPEMSMTGYSCADLFNQLWLRDEALDGLALFLDKTRSLGMVSILGIPLQADQQLFNVAVVVCQGRILGIIPKTYIPGYKEFYEPRWFSPAKNLCSPMIELLGQATPIGTDLLVRTNVANLTIGIEICEDLFMSIPPTLCMPAMEPRCC